MNPRLKNFVALIVAAAMAVMLFLQARTQSRLRDEIRSLREQLSSQETSERERVADLLNQTKASAQTANREQLPELLRLRAEVGNLRGQSNQLIRLTEENRRLNAAVAAANRTLSEPKPSSAPAGDLVPRTAWNFAGFATPDDTVQSAGWAVINGDLKTFLSSLTSSEQERFRAEMQGKSDAEMAAMMSRQHEKTTGYRINDREMLSADEQIITISFVQDGQDHTTKMRMRRIDNEWKMDGPPREPAK